MRFPAHGLIATAAMVFLLPPPASPQGETTSAIAGQVADPSGAALPGATVRLMGIGTGIERTARTGDSGRFSFSQLKPGAYSLEAAALGFERQRKSSISAAVGQTQTVDFVLVVAAAAHEGIVVTTEAPLINTDNANTATTLAAESIANLPNPGSDLTYPVQFAPGALINTAGSSNDFVGGQNGYGNVQFNGLPALSNAYIVDGLETNDPLTNLNSGLATNLVLGLNSISEVTVNTTSYAVDQGRYGASQITYITKSGSNSFHGNVYELWNGSALNAADFFTNATAGNHKPRSTVNHFGGSLGGAVRRNRLFFFTDFEQLRIALPIVTPVTVPSPPFAAYVLQQLPRGGVDSVTGAAYPAESQLVPFYRNLFSLYRGAGGTPLAVLGCPLDAGGAPAAGATPDGNGCALRRSVSQSSGDHEQVVTTRLDYNINAANTTWYRFQSDTGLQAAYTDPINPLFNAISSQPLYSFASGYTHIFSPQLVNYFNPAFSWYESLFGPADRVQTLAAFPIVLTGTGSNAPFTTLGGLDANWVQGRRATRFHVNDSLSFATGCHDFRFGISSRRLRIDDFDFGAYTTPLVTYTTLPQFMYGVASTATESFPLAASQPFNYLNVDLYAQDAIKFTAKLNWTMGVRMAHNSNPENPHALIARLTGSFGSLPHDVDQPVNAAIETGLTHLFPATSWALWQPRTAIAWQFAPGFVLRTGFGVFSDVLPGSVADLVGANPPYGNTFQGGLLGSAGGLAIAPGVPGSAIGATVAADQAFLHGFQEGNLSCAAQPGGAQANPAQCLPPVALNAVPDGRLRAPYFLQWSFGIEHQMGHSGSARAQYVGTRAIDLPYETEVNGYQTVCAGCFAPFPYGQPADPRFAAVDQLSTGANSHYNGLQLTAEKRLAHGLELHANYTWSHCLDTVSNGGFLSFSSAGILSPLPGELWRQYGNCDYDVRHNFNASYVYQLPFRTHHSLLKALVEGWQISGTVFVHSGLPFTVLSAPYSANGHGIVQGSGPQFASVVSGLPLYANRPVAGVTQPGTIQWLNPDGFISTVDPSTGACYGGDNPAHCQFGDLGRNSLRGPDFVWSDLYVTRRFRLREGLTLRVDAQFFNMLNHPNFALPSVVTGIPGQPATQTGFGAITSTTSPPTGLLGVGLGGDNSPRMIAVQFKLEF
ncbi:MAG TPA: carboxypeptidase regulatory-like domain-containing protein [Bryobacteraceae bacterium]|nr:carboxypeptidase regulatory-like domain-containing protein [Bryobacteraceae bacterium]